MFATIENRKCYYQRFQVPRRRYGPKPSPSYEGDNMAYNNNLGTRYPNLRSYNCRAIKRTVGDRCLYRDHSSSIGLQSRSKLCFYRMSKAHYPARRFRLGSSTFACLLLQPFVIPTPWERRPLNQEDRGMRIIRRFGLFVALCLRNLNNVSSRGNMAK
jgi:hypothetical protein